MSERGQIRVSLDKMSCGSLNHAMINGHKRVSLFGQTFDDEANGFNESIGMGLNAIMEKDD